MTARLATLTLLATLAAAFPSTARAADCANPDTNADRIFHPYGEPPTPCPAEPAVTPKTSLDRENENVLRDDRGPRQLQNLGISGLQGGASIAALGGFFYLISLFLAEGDRAGEVFKWGGIGVAAVGGAVFVAGGVLLAIDAITAPPAAPPGSQKITGAQVLVTVRF